MGFSLNLLNYLEQQAENAGRKVSRVVRAAEERENERRKKRPNDKIDRVMDKTMHAVGSTIGKTAATVATIPWAQMRAIAATQDTAIDVLKGQKPVPTFSKNFTQAMMAKTPMERVGMTPEEGFGIAAETAKGIARVPLNVAKTATSTNPMLKAVTKKPLDKATEFLAPNPNATQEAKIMGGVGQGATEMAGYGKVLQGANAVTGKMFQGAAPVAQKLAGSAGRVAGGVAAGQAMYGGEGGTSRAERAAADALLFTAWEALFSGAPAAVKYFKNKGAQSSAEQAALDVLGLKKGATVQEVNKAFRNASKTAHPDTGGSVEEFQKLKRAQELLTGKIDAAYWKANPGRPAQTQPASPQQTSPKGIITQPTAPEQMPAYGTGINKINLDLPTAASNPREVNYERIPELLAATTNTKEIQQLSDDLGLDFGGQTIRKLSKLTDPEEIRKIVGNGQNHNINMLTDGKDIDVPNAVEVEGRTKVPLNTTGKIDMSGFERVTITRSDGSKTSSYEARLKDVLKETDIFEKEPWLDGYSLEIKDMGPTGLGKVNPRAKVIYINASAIAKRATAGQPLRSVFKPEEAAKSIDRAKMKTVIHEVVHAVDFKYGFQPGGNTDIAPQIFKDNVEMLIQNKVKELDALTASGKGTVEDSIKINKLIDLSRKLMEKNDWTEPQIRSMYQDILGEAVARDAENRIGMTAEESAKYPFLSKSGTKPEEVLYDPKKRMGKGVNPQSSIGQDVSSPDETQKEAVAKAIANTTGPVINQNAIGPSMDRAAAGKPAKEPAGAIDKATDDAVEFVRDIVSKATNSSEMQVLFQDPSFQAAFSEIIAKHGYEKSVRWLQRKYNAVAKGEAEAKVAAIQEDPVFAALKNKRIMGYMNRFGEIPEHFSKKQGSKSLDEFADELGMDVEAFREKLNELYRQYRAARAGLAENVEDLLGIKQAPAPIPEPVKAENTPSVIMNEDIYGTAPQKYTDVIQEAEEKWGGDVAAALKATWGINPPSAHDAAMAVIELAANSPSVQRKGYKMDFWDAKSAANVLTEMGSFGGNLAMKGKFGADVDRALMEVTLPLRNAGKKYIAKAAKTQVGRLNLEKRIFNALEDRANHMTYLYNENEVAAYNAYAEFFDFWKAQMKERGMPVREDYVTHIGDLINRFDEMVKGNTLPPELSAKFKETRTKLDEYSGSKEISRIADIYDSVMRKDFAYSDLLDYYNQNVDSVPYHLTQREDFGAIRKYMENWMRQLLSPDITTKEHRVIAQYLGKVYNNFLWNNWKVSSQNYTQRWISDAYVGQEARALRNSTPPEIKKMLLEKLKPYESSMFKEVPVSAEKLSKLKVALSKGDTFKFSERTNWDYSGLNGIMEEVSQSKTYQTLVAQGMGRPEAMQQAIATEKGLLERAFVRGVSLMEQTQVGANRASQPAFWRGKEAYMGVVPKPLVLMFRRYNQAMIEMFYKTLVRPQRMREYMIYRRGLPDESFIVDSIRKGELQLQGARDMVEAIKRGEVKDIPVEKAADYIKLVQANLDVLRGVTEESEPINRKRMLYRLAKVWAAGTIINLTDGYIRVMLGTKDPDRQNIGNAAFYAIPGMMSPNPENYFVPALMPKPGNTRANVNLAFNLTPYLGTANRLTGGLMSEGVSQMLGAEPYTSSGERQPGSSNTRTKSRSHTPGGGR